MAGLLLDTNALVWFAADEPMTDDALFAIADAQATNSLFISPISAWEAAVAARKGNPGRRPNMAGDDAAIWFRRVSRRTRAQIAPINATVALEAARVPATYGSGDPGDCFIIATARVKNLTVVTRDGPMSTLADARPDYIRLIQC